MPTTRDIAFDTVVRFIKRIRCYLFTVIDHASRFASVIAVARHDTARRTLRGTILDNVCGVH